ncbi:MAG: hypothetical protein LUE64_03205 [Candidatus Gastranaerophilales bacterium]|nr:hypothetical protein [Candidatus Gastranaerophilales bacterium]
MKFLIDDVEIKTVIRGAYIEGSLSLVSRSAGLSYIYNPSDSDFALYKAKINSKLVIKNDDGDNIFKGYIQEVSYQTDKHLVNIYARDFLSTLLNTYVTGRFKGTLSSILNNALADFDFTFGLDSVLQQEVNILSLGEFTYYDIISAAASILYDDDFKIYLDGNSKLQILLPFFNNSKGDFILGQNILSSHFFMQENKNTGRIKAIGQDDVTAGTIIRVIDQDASIYGYFTVVKDKHIYTSVHTMELELKERKVSL